MCRSAYMTAISISVALNLSLTAQNATPDTQPPEVKAVLGYVLKSDYPEIYQKKPYRIRLNGHALGDVDGDGTVEVFLLVDTHYQQTPTILIFRVTKSGTVQRLVEGLAPGPLIPANGERLDSHTLPDQTAQFFSDYLRHLWVRLHCFDVIGGESMGSIEGAQRPPRNGIG